MDTTNLSLRPTRRSYERSTSSYGSATALYAMLRATYPLLRHSHLCYGMLRDATYEGTSLQHYGSYVCYVDAGSVPVFS